MLILKNIAPSLKIDDIKKIIHIVIENSLFHKNASIRAIKIILLYNRKKQEADRFAIVTLDSDKSERLVKSSLAGRNIHGKTVAAEEYIVRNWKNERRDENTGSLAPIIEQRKTERRRPHMKMEVLCELCEQIQRKTAKLLDQARNLLSYLPF